MITMLLGGLWHGAKWTFVIWGALHGIYLIAERGVKSIFKNSTLSENNLIKVFIFFITYLFVCLAWVFFRAQDFSSACKILTSMFNPSLNGDKLLTTTNIVVCAITMGGLLMSQMYFRNKTLGSFYDKKPAAFIILTWSVMLFFILLTQGSGNAFIYFQF